MLHWPNPDLKSRPTYWTISQSLDVSPQKVKLRLERLSREGVIKKMRLVLNSGFFGYYKELLAIRTSQTFQEKLLQNLRYLDFVETVHIVDDLPDFGLLHRSKSNEEKDLLLHILHTGSGDLSRKLGLIRLICGEFSVFYQEPFRIRLEDKGLKTIDQQILFMLRRNPFEKISYVASTLKVTEARVRRRLDGLLNEGVFHIEPVFNLRNIKNTLTVLFVIRYAHDDAEKVKAATSEILGNSWVQVYDEIRGGCSYLSFLDSFPQAIESYARLGSIKGVLEVLCVGSFQTFDNSQYVTYSRILSSDWKGA
ncbi:MAG: Lrp/AsnC family transcriptional regulator [Candidatus Thermoplasmatota archaeon]|jgi:DNA-binding Lrp family transcriptional regulator|nr:Lrp/AsnC family transcriptional regulator [Candidatus Thermoplasmatota archaeon]